jgi:phage major head subunit gpT-like protein
MAILNAALIAAANEGYRVLFRRGIANAPNRAEQWAQRVDSDGPAENFHFSRGIPGLREWVGEREIVNLDQASIRLVNKTYERTLGVPRESFEDDRLGMHNADIEMLGMRAAQLPDSLLADLFNSAFVTTGPGGAGYDGVAFFSTAHPRPGKYTNQSNRGAAALDADAFEAGIQALELLQDDKGEPLDLVGAGSGLVLVVPPQLRAAAKEIVMVERLANGATNPNYQAARIEVWPRLTSATAWYLGVEGLPVRGFIHQMRRAPDLVSKDRPTDDNVFMDKQVIYGVDTRQAAGYGMWQTWYGSTGV